VEFRGRIERLVTAIAEQTSSGGMQ